MIKTQGRLSFRGARVLKAANHSADYTAGVLVTWDTEAFDTDGFHDLVTNTHRLTIPAHLDGSFVEIGGAIYDSGLTASNAPAIHLQKNGTSFGAIQDHNPALAYGSMVSSGPMQVAGGDYFQLFYQVTGDTSSTVLAARSFFWIKVC